MKVFIVIDEGEVIPTESTFLSIMSQCTADSNVYVLAQLMPRRGEENDNH